MNYESQPSNRFQIYTHFGSPTQCTPPAWHEPSTWKNPAHACVSWARNSFVRNYFILCLWPFTFPSKLRNPNRIWMRCKKFGTEAGNREMDGKYVNHLFFLPCSIVSLAHDMIFPLRLRIFDECLFLSSVAVVGVPPAVVVVADSSSGSCAISSHPFDA